MVLALESMCARAGDCLNSECIKLPDACLDPVLDNRVSGVHVGGQKSRTGHPSVGLRQCRLL